jgi:hypothetical protein
MENNSSIKTVVKNNISKNLTKNNNSPNIINRFLVVAILIAICILIYIIIVTIHYYTTECVNKKPFLDYFFNISDLNVCNDIKMIPENDNIKLPKINIPNIIPNEEVFHIANQDYTYQQGKCKCESYGGKLATKSQIADAYNKGANWCTYGWSDKQEAYYPVQQCYYDDIKTNNSRLPDKEKKYCGIPGINGGYFSNPDLKFGVNCYGIKPKGSIVKPKKPFCEKTSKAALAMNFCKLDTNFEASHKLDTDEIMGFNEEKWNMN